MLGRLALVIAERADGVLTIEHRPQLAGLPFLYVVHTISQHARRSLPPLANFPILPGGRGLSGSGLYTVLGRAVFARSPANLARPARCPVVRCAESPVVRL
jgi:hypothetical protein